MPRNVTVSGGQVGQTLEVNIEFTGAECVPGDRWRLSAAGLTLTPATPQEIPTGAASHTLTWKSAAPIPAGGLASPVSVQLIKEHGVGAGPAPVQTIPAAIAPAPAAPAAPATAATVTPPANPGAPAPATPVQVQVAGPIQVQVASPTPGSAARWINGAGTMGWLGGLVIFLVVLAFLWVVLKVITPTAMNGLSGVPNVPDGQSLVVTTVEQTTVSSDPAVLRTAAEASATISH